MSTPNAPDWRWTDEDSRDLDERNRRMRKPQQYRAPVTTREAERVTRRSLSSAIETPLHKPHRRPPSPEQRTKREWEETKRSLLRAGIRPVETPPNAPPLRVRKQAQVERAPRARKCLDCGADISGRGPTASRCKEHAYQHGRNLRRERIRKSKENQQ